MKEYKDKGWMKATTLISTMDERFDRMGKRIIHSVKFVTLSGKLYYFPQVYFQGAGNFNNKEYRMRGIQPCDCKGNKEGHAFAVKITNLLSVDGYRVDWSNGYNIETENK